jgi:hypothetical protein
MILPPRKFRRKSERHSWRSRADEEGKRKIVKPVRVYPDKEGADGYLS